MKGGKADLQSLLLQTYTPTSFKKLSGHPSNEIPLPSPLYRNRDKEKPRWDAKTYRGFRRVLGQIHRRMDNTAHPFHPSWARATDGTREHIDAAPVSRGHEQPLLCLGPIPPHHQPLRQGKLCMQPPWNLPMSYAVWGDEIAKRIAKTLTKHTRLPHWERL